MHMGAVDVNRWRECVRDLFEDGTQEFEFVEALVEQSSQEIDVRSPGYAELLGKLADVGELVDFGPSVGRRGLNNVQQLLRRKKTVGEVNEWLPVGCDTLEDREQGYRDVYNACNNTTLIRDSRWFQRFDWRCKMFVWNEYPWVTATPVALLDHKDHYLIMHCEWIGEEGVQRDGKGKTVTAETWAGVWTVVEFMLLVIWSGNHYKDKPRK